MPIEPVKIPQNVQIEDRIIGSITLRQLIITILGGGVSYILWSSFGKMYGGLGPVGMVLCFIPTIVAVSFAFIKIYDLSLLRITFLYIEKAIKPGTRIWTPRIGIERLHHAPKPEKKNKKKKTEQGRPVTTLDDLTKALDL